TFRSPPRSHGRPLPVRDADQAPVHGHGRERVPPADRKLLSPPTVLLLRARGCAADSLSPLLACWWYRSGAGRSQRRHPIRRPRPRPRACPAPTSKRLTTPTSRPSTCPATGYRDDSSPRPPTSTVQL